MKQWPGMGSKQMLLMCLIYIYSDTVYYFSVNLLNNKRQLEKGEIFFVYLRKFKLKEKTKRQRKNS